MPPPLPPAGVVSARDQSDSAQRIQAPGLALARAADIRAARRVAAAHWPTLGALEGVELSGQAVRRRMRAIYAVHNPSKLGQVDRLLAKYAAQGRDDAEGRVRQWELCIKIQAKYLEPAGTGSQGGCPDCPDEPSDSPDPARASLRALPADRCGVLRVGRGRLQCADRRCERIMF